MDLSGEIDVSSFVLDGATIDADVVEAITGTDQNVIEATIEGASTITLQLSDPHRDLLNSGIFRPAKPKEAGVLLEAIDMGWECAELDKAANGLLTVSFQQQEVMALRRQRKAAKISRGKRTRAQFYKSRVEVVRRPKIIFAALELGKKQPVEKAKDAPSAEARDANRDKGIADNAKLKVKGSAISRTQRRQAERALSVADSLNASERVMIAEICSAIGESTLGEDMGPNSLGYAGVFQANVKNIDKDDTEEQAHFFLKGGKGFQAGGAIALAKSNPDLSPGAIATKVEASGEAPAFYDAFRDEAEAIVKAFGGSNESVTTTKREAKQYAFMQGPPDGEQGEDAWELGERLFVKEVGWRRFFVGNRLYVIPEEVLMASRPRMTLSSDSAGVDGVTFSLKSNLTVDEAHVDVRAALWAAPPGSVIVLEDEGPADGRWLVATIRRPLFGKTSAIDLRRGNALLKEKLEPAHEVTTSTSTRSTGSTLRDEIVKIAKAEVGYKEGAGNKNKYGPSTFWCGYFIMWVWRKAGVDNVPALQYVPAVGNLQSKPLPGDAVSYHSHIGIVTKVDGHMIETVEGNFQDAVTHRGPFDYRKSPPGGPAPIVGFRRPPGA